VLAGRYLLEGKIAAGGMGEVWRAVDKTLGRSVAVKLLRPEYAADESFLVRFRGEARHAARLSHPGVASVYDYGEVRAANGRPTAYLVMELVEGEPLSALLHRERRIDAPRMLDILGQSAAALQAAHVQGVVHRDVKPGNLLVRNDGVVKVTDFGIARAMDAAPLTATGIMMGTAYYVSPEQASGKPVTPASDVYSLGVVAYECLAGRRPFDDRNPIVVVLAHQQDTPPPLPADVPPQVRALVESAMEKSPSRRPSSAEEFARTAMGLRQKLLWDGASTGPADAPGGRPAGASGPRRRDPSSTAMSPGGGAGAGGPGAGPGSGNGLAPAPGRAMSPLTRGVPAATSGQPVAPWDRDWNAVPAPGTGGAPVGASDTKGMMIPGFGDAGSHPDDTRYAAGGDRYANLPGRPPGQARAGARRRAGALAGARRSRSLGGTLSGGFAGRPRMPLPLLVALLVVTVIVTALITRSLASSGSSASRSIVPAVAPGIVSAASWPAATLALPLAPARAGEGEDGVAGSTTWGTWTRRTATRTADEQGAGGN
jgi:serine/threonine-protein kinase